MLGKNSKIKCTIQDLIPNSGSADKDSLAKVGGYIKTAKT